MLWLFRINLLLVLCVTASAASIPTDPIVPINPEKTDAKTLAPDRRTVRKQVRGVMLSQYTVSEEDFKTLKEWGVTVARYQMYPVGKRWEGKTSEREGFSTWLDWKIGVLKGETLPLARKYGIPLVVDLHVPPGGRGGSGMKMLHRRKQSQRTPYYLKHSAKLASKLVPTHQTP